MDDLVTLLLGALAAEGRVLIKLNVDAEHRDAVLAVVPSMKAPTVSPLADGGFAIETVVDKRGVNRLIPDLKTAGATDILEIPDLEDRALTSRWARLDAMRRPGLAARVSRARRRSRGRRSGAGDLDPAFGGDGSVSAFASGAIATGWRSTATAGSSSPATRSTRTWTSRSLASCPTVRPMTRSPRTAARVWTWAAPSSRSTWPSTGTDPSSPAWRAMDSPTRCWWCV